MVRRQSRSAVGASAGGDRSALRRRHGRYRSGGGARPNGLRGKATIAGPQPFSTTRSSPTKTIPGPANCTRTPSSSSGTGRVRHMAQLLPSGATELRDGNFGTPVSTTLDDDAEPADPGADVRHPGDQRERPTRLGSRHRGGPDVHRSRDQLPVDATQRCAGLPRVPRTRRARMSPSHWPPRCGCWPPPQAISRLTGAGDERRCGGLQALLGVLDRPDRASTSSRRSHFSARSTPWLCLSTNHDPGEDLGAEPTARATSMTTFPRPCGRRRSAARRAPARAGSGRRCRAAACPRRTAAEARRRPLDGVRVVGGEGPDLHADQRDFL